ncbi:MULTISPECIES: aspartate/ornithine carbamoyltransferase family protein [Pseudoalteromonas]|uniref:Aspartate carbamoyltransferase n=1 Tax=Pseudoalteromonas ruthenica TaxID=151081 RepID=A0A0F4PV53_9GAMM|nr:MULTISPECIES: aspartate carbamoyltransferase [Pseudoalteromonas]KJY97359.1 aspartate carbamoyltransferase [Pseudoalteromonas ruthenica]KJY99307.1 aspartate carbamoyltransferase [Pseudoalteromonas ruthenica]MCF2863720.1 aspartate carbamoyltransferase [Pseudoalteromonas sp. CNAT2-18]MCG7543959.1 aspartate carbamoyltransferase [Pseudoalteromonas sp. MM17-2]MCG7559530.1 aspartate carbamoyltransferase [Pseudoalteromonas sp. CNAT2-18.1]|tara:strand:+ start:4753 stop:5832 length:1080 start_codon:yes stop_codon:yes gene_type:complete
MVSALAIEKAAFDRARPDVYGDAHPKALLRAIEEDGDLLHQVENQHIISADQLNRDILVQLFRLAAKYESNPARYRSPLQGKILISAFYEPSTRTRLSFESAWHRLGGDIMSITDRSSTGIAKGESLADVAEMFNNYGDCVVLRDNANESIAEMVGPLRIPIINAGNGIDEHPTQAMSDLYTIFKWCPALLNPEHEDFRQLKIGIVGVPNQMRTVRSLLKMFVHFPEIVDEIVLLNDQDEDTIFDSGQKQQLIDAGIHIRTSKEMDEVLPQLDVVYINAIAWVGDSFETYGKKYGLNCKSQLKKDAIILHPLARGEELSTCLDDTPHNWYFSQARGAVFLRMALLTCMVQRADTVMDVI